MKNGRIKSIMVHRQRVNPAHPGTIYYVLHVTVRVTRAISKGYFVQAAKLSTGAINIGDVFVQGSRRLHHGCSLYEELVAAAREFLSVQGAES
jgi:hypothetical protein